MNLEEIFKIMKHIITILLFAGMAACKDKPMPHQPSNPQEVIISTTGGDVTWDGKKFYLPEGSYTQADIDSILTYIDK